MQMNVNSTNTNPQFKAIKSFQCKGLYKKFPDAAKEIVDTFQANPKAMDFCSKYDVDIFLTAKESWETGHYAIKNTLLIVYENIAKSKIKKVIDWLLKNTSKDQIQFDFFDESVTQYGREKPVTKNFKKALSPWNAEFPRTTGQLDYQIDAAERDIQELLAAKAAKAAKAAEVKHSHAIGKASAQKKALEERQALDDSINELINKSK